jgi:hypothetical protein
MCTAPFSNLAYKRAEAAAAKLRTASWRIGSPERRLDAIVLHTQPYPWLPNWRCSYCLRMHSLLLTIAGPLSNLAYALDKRPDAAAKVARVWWMGGALRVPGNVYEPQSDGSAEWNAFWVSNSA